MNRITEEGGAALEASFGSLYQDVPRDGPQGRSDWDDNYKVGTTLIKWIKRGRSEQDGARLARVRERGFKSAIQRSPLAAASMTVRAHNRRFHRR